MRHTKRLLLAALLSLLLHSFVIISEVIVLPEWATAEQKVLKTRLLKKTKKLNIQQSEEKSGMRAGFTGTATNAKGQPKESTASSVVKPTHAQAEITASSSHPETVASTTLAAIKPEQPASQSKPPENTASTAPSKIAKPVTNNDARFPNEGLVVYRLKGSSIDARQTWSITPSGYKIEMRMALFGKSAHYISTGKITDEGIAPDSFKDIRDDNDTPKHIAEFDYRAHELRYGEPGTPTIIPLAPNTQDILSMGYQLAVQLSAGTSIDLQLVSGKRIYKIRFTAENEEEIETPVGVIRTAHVKGKELDGSREFDIWLDLDHQNFPVRLKGVDNNGKAVDLQLVGLTFNQKTIYRYQDYQYPSSRK